MAYIAINTVDIEVGKPTKKEIFDDIRDNQESFNTDIELLKGTSKVDIIDMQFSGAVDQYSATELESFLPIYKAPTAGDVISFTFTLLSTSTSGTLTIDIQKSIDNGVTFATILNSPTTLTGTTIGSVSGTVDFATQAFVQNDLIRIKITTVQLDQGNFHCSVYGELA